jgi:iron complex transport system substrate-binding protein
VPRRWPTLVANGDRNVRRSFHQKAEIPAADGRAAARLDVTGVMEDVARRPVMAILDHLGGQSDKGTDSGSEAKIDGPTGHGLIKGRLDVDLQVVLPSGGDPSRAVATAPATRSIDTPHDRVKLPAHPRRVVCLDIYSTYGLLDAGFTPAGVPWLPMTSILPTYLQAMRSISTVGAYTNPDPQKIASLDPDLILGLAVPYTAYVYHELSGIAPTVLLPWSGPEDWAPVTVQFANLVGRENQMAGLKQQYQDRCLSLKREFAETLSTTQWAVVQGSGDDDWYLYGPESPPGQILSETGVQFVAAAVGKTGLYQTFIAEQIRLLRDADVIIIDALSDYTLTTGTQRLLVQPGWKRLKAVKAQHVYPSPACFPMGYSGALDFLSWVEELLTTLGGVP